MRSKTTNFSSPGPQEEVQFWGDTLDGVVFWVPDRSPTGAGVGMISYNGTVRMGIIVDGGLVGDTKEVRAGRDRTW